MPAHSRRPARPPGDVPDDVFNVEAAIAGLPDAYVECRDLGHNIRPYAVAVVPQLGCYEVSVRCVRCRAYTKTRLVEMSTGAVVTAWKTAYKDGYLVPGMGRLDPDGRNLVRRTSCERFLAQFQVAEQRRALRSAS